MDSKGYVYLVYREINPNNCDIIRFIGKFGRGTGDRWKSYVTPYGHKYTAAIVYVDQEKDVEPSILQWCRENGLICRGTETISVSVNSTDTIYTCVAKYNLVVSTILDRMRLYGDIEYHHSNETEFSVEQKKNISIDELCYQMQRIPGPELQTDISLMEQIMSKSNIQYNSKEDSVRSFLKEYHWHGFKKTSDVYGDYKKWCGDNIDVVAAVRFKIHAGNMIETRKNKNYNEYL